MLTKLFAFRPGTHNTHNEATFVGVFDRYSFRIKSKFAPTKDLDRKSLFLEAGTTSKTSCVSLKPADFSRLTVNAGLQRRSMFLSKHEHYTCTFLCLAFFYKVLFTETHVCIFFIFHETYVSAPYLCPPHLHLCLARSNNMVNVVRY